MKNDNVIHIGSGNIFADIGLPRPDKMLARSKIMFAVNEIIRAKGLTQKEVSKVLSIPQPKVSCLIHGKLSLFSMDTLLRFLEALNQNVDIFINNALVEGTAAINVSYGVSSFSGVSNGGVGWKRFNSSFTRRVSPGKVRPEIAEIISVPIDVGVCSPIDAGAYSLVKCVNDRREHRLRSVSIKGVAV